MAWNSVSLRTADRSLSGAWANLNAAIARALGDSASSDANLFPAANGTLNPIEDGRLLMMAGDGAVRLSTGAWDALCVGVAEGEIPGEGGGLVRKGGIKSIPMVAGIPDLAAGQAVYASATDQGKGTTTPGAGSAIAVVVDASDYTAGSGWRCAVELMLTATPGLDPN